MAKDIFIHTPIRETESVYHPVQFKKAVYAHLLKNFDEPVIERLLKTAVTSMEGYLDSIKKNILLKDRKALRNTLHALQGMLINLGLEEEANTAKEIQNILKLHDFQNINSLIENFLQTMTDLLKELQKNIT